MNKIILGLLLLIPVAKISTVEHTADIHSDGGDSVKLPHLLRLNIVNLPL